MDYTGVSARQRAGTLERVLKYDQEAFTKAWDYLAKSPSDDEDDQTKYFFPTFFFYRTFLGLEKGRNTAILGPTDFFSGARTCWVVESD